MKISMHTMAVDSFAPMLESLSSIFGKAVNFAEKEKLDLVNARLAPDMYTLAQQVQQATYYARDGISRLAGRPAAPMPETETTLTGCETQIDETIRLVRAIPADNFEGAETRDCRIEISDDKIIEMDGLRFLRSWALPHFYFHIVTAYDILRHKGMSIGKMDYLSQVGGFVRSSHSPPNRSLNRRG